MKVKDVGLARITVELSILDAVCLAGLCEEGAAGLIEYAPASRLSVPRVVYLEALGAALRTGALAAVAKGHVGPAGQASLEGDWGEVGSA